MAKQQIKVNKIKSTTLDFKKNLLSKNSIKVLKKLDQSGFQAFLVGGCIRDLLIGEKPKDFDIATNCLLYTSPSPRDNSGSRMPSSA